jgi:hypothetical protein
MTLLLDQREEEVIKSLVRIRENNSGIEILGARLFRVRSSRGWHYHRVSVDMLKS